MGTGKMTAGLRLALSLALASTVHALAGPPGSAVAHLPNGIIDGKPDAKYGTYYTVIQVEGRSYQERLLDLENKSYGLAKLADGEYVAQTESVYLLEHEVVRLYLDIAGAPADKLTDFERRALLGSTIRAYNQVRHHAERVYENMIRYIDKKLPGPNGLQILEEDGKTHEALYSPNYRSDQELTEAEKRAEYDKKLEGFLKKGGSLAEIKTLTPKLFRSLPPYSRFEYVWLSDGSVKITAGNAGHLLLAKGAQVKSAGQIVFLRGPGGKSPGMIVTNASGTYKPDIYSAQELAHHLSSVYGIDPDQVAVTKGEPLSSQGLKIFLKADGKPPAEIDSAVKALEATGKEILSRVPQRAGECAEVFN